MWSNPQFPADLVTFTEEILNGKLHFLCSAEYLRKRTFLLLCTPLNNKNSNTFTWKSFSILLSLSLIITKLSKIEDDFQIIDNNNDIKKAFEN